MYGCVKIPLLKSRARQITHGACEYRVCQKNVKLFSRVTGGFFYCMSHTLSWILLMFHKFKLADNLQSVKERCLQTYKYGHTTCITSYLNICMDDNNECISMNVSRFPFYCPESTGKQTTHGACEYRVCQKKVKLFLFSYWGMVLVNTGCVRKRWIYFLGLLMNTHNPYNEGRWFDSAILLRVLNGCTRAKARILHPAHVYIFYMVEAILPQL